MTNKIVVVAVMAALIFAPAFTDAKPAGKAGIGVIAIRGPDGDLICGETITIHIVGEAAHAADVD